MSRFRRFLFVELCAATVVCACLAVAFGKERGGRDEPVSQRLGDDLFMTGSELQMAGETAGDAILAGRKITTSGSIQGDNVVAGGELTLQAPTGGDLYAAGGKVRLDAEVSGNARMAGGQVHVGREGIIQGGASIAGGDIVIDGRVGRYLQVAGGDIRINGRIDGDVRVTGGELSVGPEAVIEGALSFRGSESPDVASGAQIKGGMRYIEKEGDAKDTIKRIVGGAAIVWLLGWVIVGCLLLALWPRVTRAVSETEARRPLLALLIGFLVLVCVPVAVVLLAITLIGIPLALLLMALYFVVLPLGYLASIMTIGDALLARLRKGGAVLTRHRIAALIGAAVLVFLATLIPILGPIVAVLVVVIGVGSVVLLAVSRHRAGAAVA